MSFDLATHLGAMTRSVRDIEKDGKPARSLIAARVFDTDAADLWDALTDKDRIKRWFLPVSGDFVLNGRFQFEGNAAGSITGCDPERSLDVTWEYGGGVSWVTIRLESAQGGTRLELEHVAIVDPSWGDFGSGAVGIGWDTGFMGLARHLATGEAVPEGAAEAWMATPEAKEFYRLTSAAWGRADIASGMPEGKAMAAAEQIRAMYAGEQPG